MNEQNEAQDPAAIERDIRVTQERMSQTVDRIGNQLTLRNLMDALLDQADSNNIDARKLLDGARRNPLALAMIAGGAIWLVSDNDAKFPSFGHDDDTAPKDSDAYHRDYIAHMERVEPRDDEDRSIYQRRRDLARSNYFMVERSHDEDDASFRERLDQAADAFRAKRKAWSDQAQRAGDALADTSKTAVTRTKALYRDNPLVGGLIAAAIGGIVGSLVPLTETEDENLSELGQRAREMASDQTDRIVQGAREHTDDLVAAVEDELRPYHQASSSHSGTAQP